MKPLYYTFDLDGTLIDSKQQLKPGVVEMFDQIAKNQPNAIITIASGARPNQIKAVVDDINRQLKNGKINPTIIACGGSYIQSSNSGTLIKHLTHQDIHAVEKSLEDVGAEAIRVLRTEYGDFYPQPVNKKEKALYKLLEKVGSSFGIEPLPLSNKAFGQMIANGDVLSLEYIILDKKKRNEFVKQFSVVNKNPTLNISGGTSCQIANFGKKGALIERFGEGALKKMVYMGDGMNDVEMFKNSYVSFGVGSKFKAVRHAHYAIPDYQTATNYLFGEESKVGEIEEISKTRLKELKQSKIKKLIKKAILKNKNKKLKRYEQKKEPNMQNLGREM